MCEDPHVEFGVTGTGRRHRVKERPTAVATSHLVAWKGPPHQWFLTAGDPAGQWLRTRRPGTATQERTAVAERAAYTPVAVQPFP